MQNQKIITDRYKYQNIENILLRTLSCQKYSKTINQTHQRQLYSQLLEYASAELNKNILQFKVDTTDAQNQPKKLLFSQRQFVQLLANQIIKFAQRQCIQKSSLLSLLFTYYRESLAAADLLSQQKIADSIKEYCNNIEKQKIQYQQRLDQKQSKLAAIQKMNNQKWKSFYLVVNDNRVLRRQKGKLVRLLTDERNKLSKVHQQMIEIAKQNQKNRLLATYAKQSISLQIYIKNHNSILKLEKFMKSYPKYAKRLLKMDLQKLQTMQNTNIDQKIQYILKSVQQQQEIFDEYQDLTDMMNEQLNKLIFNVSTQTYVEDFVEEKEIIKSLRGIHPNVKKIKNHRGTQTNAHGRIKIYSNVIKMEDVYRRVPQNNIRRRAIKLDTYKDVKMIEAVNTYKESHQIKRTINMKLVVQSDKREHFELVKNLYSIAINCSVVFDFPKLPTNYRLQNDMRRGKQISRRDFLTKKLSRVFITSSMSLEKQQCPSKSNLNEIQYLQKMQNMENQKSNKNIKYIINLSKTQADKKNKPNPTDLKKLTNINIINEQNTTEELIPNQKQTRTNKKSIKKKESLQEMMKKNPRISIQIQKQNTQISEINQSERQQTFRLNIPQDKNKAVRKSGFMLYKNSKSKIVTEPDEADLQEQEENGFFFNNQKSLQKITPSKVSRTTNSISKRMSCQVQKISRFSRLSEMKELQKIINCKNQNTGKKDQIKKVGGQQKVINIISPQFLRLADKIVRSIYSRKKQIFQGKLNFQAFLKSFMTTQYGSQTQLTLVSRFTKTVNSPILSVFDLLLNSHQSKYYLQHIFSLLAKIITLNGGDGLQVSEERGRQIFKIILKLYVKDQFVEENIRHFYQLGYEGNFTNLANNFISIQKCLKQQLNNSELYSFLQLLLPRSQPVLSYEQIREVFGLFQFEADYHERLFTMKRLTQSEISIYNLCFWASRQRWSPLLDIKCYITQQYERLFGQFDQQTAQEYISQKKVCKYDWSIRIVQQNLRYCLYVKAEDKILLMKYISILLLIHYIEQEIPLGQNLAILSKQYLIVAIKKKTDSLQC